MSQQSVEAELISFYDAEAPLRDGLAVKGWRLQNTEHAIDNALPKTPARVLDVGLCERTAIRRRIVRCDLVDERAHACHR